MKRTLSVFVAMSVLVLGIAASVTGAPTESFCFAHITDSHILSEKSIEDYQAVLNTLTDIGDRVKFIIKNTR